MLANVGSSETQNRHPKKESKAQLRHALIDVDFCDKPKILDLGERFGELAVFLSIKLLLAMSRATNAEVSWLTCRAIGKRTGFTNEQTDTIVQFCIDVGIFFESSDGISNHRVVEDQEKLGVRQEKWREKKRLQRDNGEMSEGTEKNVQGDVPGDTPCMSKGTLGVQESEELKTEDLNVFVFKEEGCGEKPKPKIKFDIPEPLQRWIEYRAERKPKLTSASIKQILKKYAGRVGDLERDVDHSISQGYQGLFPPKEQVFNARAGPPGPSIDPRVNLILNSLDKEKDT